MRQGLAATSSITGFATSGASSCRRQAAVRETALCLQPLLQLSRAQDPDKNLTSKARLLYRFQLSRCQGAVRDTGAQCECSRKGHTHIRHHAFEINKLFIDLDSGRLHFASLWKNPRIPKCLRTPSKAGSTAKQSQLFISPILLLLELPAPRGCHLISDSSFLVDTHTETPKLPSPKAYPGVRSSLITAELVRKAEFSAPHQTHRIRVCVLAKPPGDVCAHRHLKSLG